MLTLGILFLLLASALSTSVHDYNDGQKVPVMVNVVGPYKNPTETYGFYEKIPFCKPEDFKKQIETLGEVLEGNRLTTSVYNINFKEEIRDKVACSINLEKKEVDVYLNAIKNEYYFQLFLDDLPIVNFVGVYFSSPQSYYLYTHLEFFIEYNQNNIVRANLSVVESPETMVEIEPGSEALSLVFTYSVSWFQNDQITLKTRMQNYADVKFTSKELEIHWFSIINSAILVVILIGFLFAVLVRMLKADYAKYAVDREGEEEDFGWKLIHADVFRVPKHRLLFSSVLGVGIQFLMICIGILLLGGVGIYYPYNRGSLKTSMVILYSITCVISGFVSASFYHKLNGEKWVWNILLTSSIFTGPLFLVWSILNTIAWVYKSSQALPFGTILAIFLIWALICLPLTVVGGILGKNRSSEISSTVPTRSIPRHIPISPWYHSQLSHLVLAGFLPFSAISIELYYIFGAIWGYKLYTVYGILMIVFFILLLVTSFITISLVYFQLCCENHEWWWRSLLNGGSTGIFIFFYAVFFYFNGSSMTGVLQLSFFFGYVLLFCYASFLMLGSVGFFSSYFFIKKIYSSFRVE